MNHLLCEGLLADDPLRQPVRGPTVPVEQLVERFAVSEREAAMELEVERVPLLHAPFLSHGHR